MGSLSCHDRALGLLVDVSHAGFEPGSLDALALPMARALDRMAALEAGLVANADEGRMVGHYWLRAPELAPAEELTRAIVAAEACVLELSERVLSGAIRGGHGKAFRHAIVVGIGGSALGPQLLVGALKRRNFGLELHFADNTDPDGFDELLALLDGELDQTLCVVISKSGATKETRNAMLELAAGYRARGLSFGAHAVAITQADSELDRYADAQGFIARLPMWDWIGGRTSVTSAVGLYPAALAGLDIRALLAGAAAMDVLTRRRELAANPAALLAAAWHIAGKGVGARNLVVLPYKDRLSLFARYLQQLVMESLGKYEDREGNVVMQGLTVYGNKGSTDQHAYVQQLRDGRDDSLTCFIEVLRDREGASFEVEPGVTSGDYLAGFLHGTRRALDSRARPSVLVSVAKLDAESMGALIALFERAVGLYAELIDVNAYHQPGVEAGKRAAGELLTLQAALLAVLPSEPAHAQTAEALAARMGTTDAEGVLMLVRHLHANGRARAVEVEGPWYADRYCRG
ncbi:MAG: glucose-6-phosphate isomerase [Myxococcales bacterium]|nr:glucose-6-phosphate isomerase [Myxococcales bacterium]